MSSKPTTLTSPGNAGTGTTEYTKLQNAIKAGSGVPDIAQVEYYALPQFALGGSLADLGADGLSSDQSQFSTAVWDSVQVSGKLVGLPQDTGRLPPTPTAMPGPTTCR